MEKLVKRILLLIPFVSLLASCGQPTSPPAAGSPNPAAAVTGIAAAPADNDTGGSTVKSKSFEELAAAIASFEMPERKNIVSLTPAAVAQAQQLMKSNPGAEYLRVTVTDEQYQLTLTGGYEGKDVFLGESGGISIIVDRKSAQSIPPGLVVDFVTQNGKAGFAFMSPEPNLSATEGSMTLAEARRSFKTSLSRRIKEGIPHDKPPPDVFQFVKYSAPPGDLGAYVSPDPGDGKKHPAIVWITGGDCNTIDQGCWGENDQSASAYRKAGIVMMFPSLRGGNDNPGVKEGLYGEVEDVISAAAYLGKLPYVDASRVYLGGHSTGGTLVLLTAECTDQFRAVFSFGPVGDILGYGPEFRPFALSNVREFELRSPIRWLHSVRSPVFVIEGSDGNLRAMQAMARLSKNDHLNFFEIKNTDHFAVLGPTNRLIAEKILQDTGTVCNLAFTADELNRVFQK